MATVTSPIVQTDILSRALESQGGNLPAEVASFLLALDLSAEDRVRLNELAEKARIGTLATHEASDLEEYRRFGRLVELLKLKARRSAN